MTSGVPGRTDIDGEHRKSLSGRCGVKWAGCRLMISLSKQFQGTSPTPPDSNPPERNQGD